MYVAIAVVYIMFLYNRHRFLEYLIVNYCVITGIFTMFMAIELAQSGWAYGTRWTHMTASDETYVTKMYTIMNIARLVSGVAVTMSPLPVLWKEMTARRARRRDKAA